MPPTQPDVQRDLNGQITEAAKSLAQLHLLLFAQSGRSIPARFLVILVFWLTIIFASFSLFGPMNTTMLAFKCLFAVSAAGAIFLIYELDCSFTGILQISKAAMLDARGMSYVLGVEKERSREGRGFLLATRTDPGVRC